MKVLIITPWYPAKDRPVEALFIRELAKVVRDLDDMVVLHMTGHRPDVKGSFRLERETDDTLSQGITTFRAWYRCPPLPGLSLPFECYNTFRAFRRILAGGFRPDLIHAHLFSAGFTSVLLGKLYRLPVAVSEHYSIFMRKLQRRHWLKAKFAFENAELVMPVSLALQQAIQAHGIRGRFRVVPNAVDTVLFHPKCASPLGPTKRLLAVTSFRFASQKGVPVLLKALARLGKIRGDWHLDIIGDGRELEDHQRMAGGLGLLDKVTFQGAKPKSEVAEWMRRADLLVVSSLHETFSVVAAEALATGTPVLATRCGGPEEFITPNVGMLVPPGDEDALLHGLDYMLDHLHEFSPSELSDYAERRFSLKSVGDQLHAAYQACLDEYKG